MKARPTGITIIAAVYIFWGLLSLLLSLVSFGISSVSALMGSLFNDSLFASTGGSNLGLAAFSILLALVQLAVGVGLFGMKKWAWYIALFAAGLTIVQGIMGVFGGGGLALICGGIGLIIPVIVVVYLLSGKIRTAFGTN